VLDPVYDALGLEWDPGATGSVDDAIGSTVWDDVANAIASACGREAGTIEAELPGRIIDEARALLPASSSRVVS
jgi:hypothetical protein